METEAPSPSSEKAVLEAVQSTSHSYNLFPCDMSFVRIIGPVLFLNIRIWGVMWTRLIWLRLETSGGLCEHGNEL
jgi:hypothetical protein